MNGSPQGSQLTLGGGEGWRQIRLLAPATLGAVLLGLSFSDRLAYYLNPSQAPLVGLAGALLLGLVAAASRAGKHEHGAAECRSSAGRFAMLVALALPACLALLPARPLGAAAALTLGVDGAPPSRSGQAGKLRVAFGTEHWTLADWYRAWGNDPELQTLAGKRVAVDGFVLRPAGEADVSFRVARILITHCTADSQALALPVRAGQGDWRIDEWVRVEGTVAALRDGGPARPIIVAERVERIEPPDRPYLTP